MTYEEAAELLKAERPLTPVEHDMVLGLAIEALEYRAEVEKYGSELGMMLAHEKLYKERQAKLDAEWEDCKSKYPSLGGQE